MSAERTRFALDGGSVSGARHLPDGDVRATMVIGHGAGGNMDAPFLVRFGDAAATRGFECVRFNFPHSEAGRKSPGSPAAAQACVRAVLEQCGGARVLAGGKSYGGRMASHAVADGAPAAGLVFLGYPLHAPGKTDQIRDAHLHGIEVPILFLQGTRDAFARLDLIQAITAKLSRATLHLVEGGDHSFAVPGRKGAEITEELAEAVAAWIDSVTT